MSEPRAYMEDVRALGYCARGAREFFTRYGLDWSEFLAYGVPCERLEATGDALGINVAAKARERQS